ncbi:tetratricopeptide repeat protein [Dactylosporangium sp. CA-233914]|uniref:tetratricopeptide repeat protein n=1 Tax=Dactylosporangium sp. CA-233914 TaxID=3239934 RepID=UPI003D8E52EE
MAFWTGALSALAGLVTNNQLNGPQNALDVGDKLGGIITTAIAVYALMRPQRKDPPPSFYRRDAAPLFVDRNSERSRLRWALRSRWTRVIVVQGDEGVGKTELVTRVVKELNVPYHTHQVTPTDHPSADTLVRDLAAGGDSTDLSGPPFDESMLGRLERALARYHSERVVIVIDNAELLLDQDGHLTDLALDEAFQALAIARHRVRVILVTNVLPQRSDSHERWLPRRPITVRGLPFGYFKSVVGERRDSRSRTAAFLDDETLRRLWRDLGGQLRLAELFDAITERRKSPPAADLAAKVRAWVRQSDDVGYIRKRLIGRLMETLSPEGKRVYEALAAFAAPVNADDVTSVVNSGAEPEISLEDIQQELGELSRYVVRNVDGLYFLPIREAQRALDWSDVPEAEAQRMRWLLRTAALRLKLKRVSSAEPHQAGRSAYFPEIDAFLRADLPIEAYKSMIAIDTAGPGRPDLRLRARREKISEQISPDLQPANYNVLGYLFHRGENFDGAEEAFRQVLDLDGGVPGIQATARLHLGWLHWSRGDAGKAHEEFEEALRLAPGASMVRASALEGLARASRREVRFTDAVELMERAHKTTDAGSPQRVRVAVRLARLYLDVQRNDDAERVVEEAREIEHRHPDESLRALCLDALADVRLAQDRDDEALSYARQALELALRNHDSFTGLQARLTICAVRLRTKDFRRARREAALAERYRDAERSLIVIAIRAVAARRLRRRNEARAAFESLLMMARKRTGNDGQDFAAWELAGLALCGLHLEAGGPAIHEAVDAINKSRPNTAQAAPGHAKFMTFLVYETAVDRAERERLRPVLAILERDLVQPSAR